MEVNNIYSPSQSIKKKIFRGKISVSSNIWFWEFKFLFRDHVFEKHKVRFIEFVFSSM